jgi:hypothetical protein
MTQTNGAIVLFLQPRTARRSEFFKLRGFKGGTNQFYKALATRALPENPRQLRRAGWIETAWCARVLKTKTYKQSVDSIPLTNGDTDDSRFRFCFSAVGLVAPYYGEILNINGGSVLSVEYYPNYTIARIKEKIISNSCNSRDKSFFRFRPSQFFFNFKLIVSEEKFQP